MSSNLSKTINQVLSSDRENLEPISDERDVRAATAPHQAEFPYDRDDEVQVTRREFCNFLFLTSTAMFVGAAGFAGKSAYDSQFVPTYTPIKVEGATELQPGSALNFRYPTEKDSAILIRAERKLLRLRTKMHAFVMSGLLRKTARPSQMPVS